MGDEDDWEEGNVERLEIVDQAQAHIDFGEDTHIEHLLVSSNSKVTLTGSTDQLTLEVFTSRVDASALVVGHLTLDAEQSQVIATAARAVSGFAGYGSTLEVGPNTNTHDVRTPNAGRVVRAE